MIIIVALIDSRFAIRRYRGNIANGHIYKFKFVPSCRGQVALGVCVVDDGYGEYPGEEYGQWYDRLFVCVSKENDLYRWVSGSKYCGVS